MIDYFIRKIPSCDVSFEDFPYLKKYFSYIISEVIEVLNSKEIPPPKFAIRDTPYLESQFLESDEDGVVVFDVSASLLLTKLTSVLLTGSVTREAWLSLLTTGVNSLIPLGYSHIGVSLALNRSWDMMDSLSNIGRDSDSLCDLSNEFWGEHGRLSANIRCQEMFILTHELTHYFVTKDVYNLKSVSRTIYDDLIKNRSGDISTTAFFAKVFGHMKPGDDENQEFYKRARKEFFSPSFREEMLCDLNAAEITIEYFTWDGDHMSHEEVCSSIQVVMRSLILATSLRNHLRILTDTDGSRENKKRLDVQLFLRTKVLDAFLSKVIKNQSSFNAGKNKDEAVKRIVDYDVIHFENLRKRTAAIETCFFDDIIRIIGELEKVYPHIDRYISNTETSALHYLGYNSIETEAEEFLRTDGSVFMRNEGLLDSLSKQAKIDLYHISEESIEKAQKLMQSTIW